jgi:peptide/nickel transport system ATP-binding protein
MLKLDGVSKVYKVGTFGGKRLLAVNNVSFNVQDSEVVSLIGESGSGKTTIGKMILHLAPITSGTIGLDGVDVSKLKGNALKEYYRKVQGVFQDPFSSYNPIFKADRIFRTIREEFFPGIDNGEWNTKIDSSLSAVGLNPDEVVNKFPHQLSGGQLQRFLIARALLLDVQVLVADEIISMLDASTRVGVLNLLAELKSRGLSILFITHDLSLGYYISEKSVILYRGCVVEMGPTEQVYHHPLHPYTKMLMACVPRLGAKWECRDIEETDLKAEHSALPSGCVYYDRCPLVGKERDCNRSPSLVEVEHGHFVACWHQEKQES